MSLAARSPKSRQSLSIQEHNLNATIPITRPLQPKKRVAVSIGGEGLGLAGFQLGGNKGDEMSPRRKARRSMQPRKSILKPNVAEDETFDYSSRDYAHTITFSSVPLRENVNPLDRKGRQSLGRRVSFAPNAHVRMFETSLQQSTNTAPPSPIPTPSGPRPSNSAHARRSSIQNLASLSAQPEIFQGEGESLGEESMELETESEASDDDDDEGLNPFSGQQPFVFGVTPPDDEEEVDMEESKVYGGVAYYEDRQFEDEEDMDEDEGADDAVDDEEKTMDFTIAVGGLIPPAPPAGAYSDRNSIGYTIPGQVGEERLIPGEGEGDEMEMEMEMDETVAFGGIIGDDSLSSAGEDMDRERTMTFSFGTTRHGDGMDMTVAGGGILSFSGQSPNQEDGMDMTIATGGILALPSSAPAIHISPMKRSMPTNTHPTSGTPSFARPTAASAQKAKRNVFAPSPSPVKSVSTPRSAASQVAKRLSFGSTTSSGGKRSRNDQDMPAGKRQVIEGVFGGPMISPRKISPSKQLAKSPRNGPSPHPGTPRKVGFPQSGDVEEIGNSGEEWEQPPTISLAAFLEMTGVQFIEGLQGLTRRRSVAKGVLGSTAPHDRDFALHEYAEGELHSVFLHMYSWASDWLVKDIKAGQAELLETESLSSLHNPPVIKEYLSASDEDKQLFEMTFKAFKTNTQLKARERWYEWKSDVMEKIRPDVEEMLHGMQEDDQHLTSLSDLADGLLPQLQDRLASLQAELVKEREVVAEITACDQAELADFKAAVAEQGAQIANFTSELEESTAKLDALTLKLDELLSKKSECQTAISTARSKCDQFTKSDVARLQEEYTSIQHLHLWRPVIVNPNMLELTYDNEIKLSFECSNYSVHLGSASITLIDRGADASAKEYVDGMIEIMTQGVMRIKQDKSITLSKMVQKIGNLWTSVQRLRSEFRLISTRYPVTFQTRPLANGRKVVIASVKIMIGSTKSKCSCEFVLDDQILLDWPGMGCWEGLEVDVKVVYGFADPTVLTEAAKAVLGSAMPEAHVGVFLQTCVDVAGQ